MKRLVLNRSAIIAGVARVEGEIIEVNDPDAEALLHCAGLGAPPTATVLADLGPDPGPPLSVTVTLTRAVRVNGMAARIGQVVQVSEKDAQTLIAAGFAVAGRIGIE